MLFSLNAQQSQCVEQMQQRERDGFVRLEEGGHVLSTRLSINGCDAGSGKTRAMLELVYTMRKEQLEPVKTFQSCGLYTYTSHQAPGPVQHTTIVLTSPSVRAQWVRELKGSCLRYTVLDNTRKLESFDASTCDVALVGSTVYKRLASDGKPWRRLIFDEADSYLFPGMEPLSACFTWLVTATWGSLSRFDYNCRTRRTHAMRKMIQGAPLEALVIKVPASLGLPPIRECIHAYRCATSLARTVAPVLSADFMTRINAGDIVGAIESLGGDASTTNIVELVRGRRAAQTGGGTVPGAA